MQTKKLAIGYLLSIILTVVTAFVWLMSSGQVATASIYTDSAHGNDSYGVNRSESYTIGACTHCHETFDFSICCQNQSMLFEPCDENLCFGCHKASDSCQAGDIDINKSYSCNFGGNADEKTCDDDIVSAFSHGTSGSSHWLGDIKSFAMGTDRHTATGSEWSLNDNLTPCDGCHNPHIARRNCNSPYDSTKSAISRPSDRNNLWGDIAVERMSVYTYQAPYWDNSSGTYEPANNATADGSNMPDYPTFCTDCHNTNNTINSTNPCLPRGNRLLVQINWSIDGDKHGAKAADGGLMLRDPYSSVLENKVLSCTDCHEPHGSKDNVLLIRTEVNDGNLDGNITTLPTADWGYLCSKCHKDDSYVVGGSPYKFRQVHHLDSDAPYPSPGGCASCHEAGNNWNKSAISCDLCHFHGGDDSYYEDLGGTPTDRPTF